ncbi:Sensor histidine kinase ResE [Nymphon striatum]|nr:Sensor histidine kinase ResE [Nymphon striatum]
MTSAQAKMVELRAELGSPVIEAGRKQTTFLKVALTGFKLEDESDRTPANIAIVLDKSGSMRGDKLESAKQAARMAVNLLNENDIISIVSYDSTVNVLVPATKVSDKKAIHRAIDKMRSNGKTALQVKTNMSQLYSEQEKFVLIEVEVPAGRAKQQVSLADVSVAYQNMQSKKQDRLADNMQIAYSAFASRCKAMHLNRSVEVTGELNKWRTEASKKALRLRDKGQLKEAQELLKGSARVIQRKAEQLGGSEGGLLNMFSSSISEDAEAIVEEKDWNKNRKSLKAKQYKLDKQHYFEEMQIKWGLQIQRWSLSNDQIRKRIDDNGNIRQIFVIDAQNKRQFPPRNEAVTQSEQTFVDRLELIWRDPQMLVTNQSNQIEFGENLADIKGQQVAINTKKSSRSISPSAASYSSTIASSDSAVQLEEQASINAELAPVSKTVPSKIVSKSKSRVATPKSSNQAKRQGWYMWHWGSDSNLIFWQQKSDGTIVGVEMEPTTVPDDESSDFRLRLLDTAGQVVYQWGNYRLSTSKDIPQQKRPLSYPLSSWALEYHGEPYNQSALSQYTLFLTFLGFAFLISALAWFLYREQTREMRLAEQRVQFVSQVSHELKTPLTNIRMYAEMLEGQLEQLTAEEEQPKRYVQIITDESKRLSRLISNVLNFSRAPRVHKREIYPDDVVRQSIEHFAPSLEAKQIAMKLALKADAEILSDPDILEQVLNNLLSNVEKYAAHGKRLDIKSEIKDKQYFLSVRDYGDGITKSERKHIFKPFYRISDKLTEGVSGTGIGLTIARQQAQHLDGSLDYIDVDQGACFELRIPIK